MSTQEPPRYERPRVDRGWNHARFTVATRLPTAVARARYLNRATLRAVNRSARLK